MASEFCRLDKRQRDKECRRERKAIWWGEIPPTASQNSLEKIFNRHETTCPPSHAFSFHTS